MILLITYDLNKPGQDYPGLYDALKSSGWWWHHLDSTWIVRTSETPETIFNRLTSIIDRNDTVLIIEVRRNYWGLLPQKAWTWLQEAFTADGQ